MEFTCLPVSHTCPNIESVVDLPYMKQISMRGVNVLMILIVTETKPAI